MRTIGIYRRFGYRDIGRYKMNIICNSCKYRITFKLPVEFHKEWRCNSSGSHRTYINTKFDYGHCTYYEEGKTEMKFMMDYQ